MTLRMHYIFELWMLCCIWSQTWLIPVQGAADQCYAEHVFLSSLKVFTVATEPTDGYVRFIHSARSRGIEVTTLGMNTEWKGKGGQKIRLLRQAIKTFRFRRDIIILYCDSYDTMFIGIPYELYTNFENSGANVLFPAYRHCHPNSTLSTKYPKVRQPAKRYLHSAAFVGFAPQVYSMLQGDIKDEADDQVFFTNIFLNATLRQQYGIMLDTESIIFEDLVQHQENLEIDFGNNQRMGTLQHKYFGTKPSIIFGDGKDKMQLNGYENFLINQNTFSSCCSLKLNMKNMPTISLTIFILRIAPFVDLFLKRIKNIDYPKQRMHLFIYSNQLYHDDTATAFVKSVGKTYLSANIVLSTAGLDERQGRELALKQAIEKKSDYIFVVESDVHIENPEILQRMLMANRKVISPLPVTDDNLRANSFAMKSNWHDYSLVFLRKMMGVFNVPYISSIYLMKNTTFKYIQYNDSDPELAMAKAFNNVGIFMYVTNELPYSHFVSSFQYNTSLVRPDFFMFFENVNDWIEKYIHPSIYDVMRPDWAAEQPCPDVFTMPLVTDAFCDDILAIINHSFTWMNGSDDGGYISVPTCAIKEEQTIIFHIWQHVINLFIPRIQNKIYLKYFKDAALPIKQILLVRYSSDLSMDIPPHFDFGALSINIALNGAGEDYQGGGFYFVRYNCTFVLTKKGWATFYPGRLTHHHKSLPVTNGTRYVMITQEIPL